MSFLRNNVKIDNLFDIGKNMESLTGNESVLNDQNDKRKFRLSEEIDIEYEIEKQQELEMEREMMEQQADEYRYMMDDCDEETSNISVPDQINVSLNRSGLTRNCASSVDSSTQTEFVVNRPKIRKVRDCSNAIKSTCAEVSVKCNISTDCSRIAVQTVSNGLYNHKYYLNKEEAIENDPALIEYKEALPKPNKRTKTGETRSTPVSSNDYKIYENVLPTTKTINDHKQMLTIQHEKDAATALINISIGTKVTLHYDTTTRSKIDGDWPALILIFSDGQRFPLRPLFFAFEDRNQIVRLIVETYNRLSATILSETSGTAKDLWEKTTAIMTDSVSKNLKIEDGVAETLHSDHKPYHLLCKSHAVEAFDWSNLEILALGSK